MPLDFDLDGIDVEQIGRLMEVLAEGEVEECEIEQGERKLTLRRVAREPSGYDTRAPSPVSAEDPSHLEPISVRAPAVGVFYRSEERSAPPLVEVGARVRVGDVLGFIEVMSVPQEVPTAHDGTVERFLVEDGQPVEYGQPLVSIQRSAIGGQLGSEG